ncbi:zinc finger, RING/FYVE/PHD-type containing protein [Tanacetum coccineum]
MDGITSMVLLLVGFVVNVTISEYSVDQEDDAEEAKRGECAVCLDGFKDGDKCRMLRNCKHSFHVNCIDLWLINTAVCPICRTSVEIERSGREDRFPGDVCLELT